jgi:hypothetical protein
MRTRTHALPLSIRSQQVGIDLSLLTAVLCPVEALQEPDEPWEFDRLLQEVSQALQAEADAKEAEESGGGSGGGSGPALLGVI